MDDIGASCRCLRWKDGGRQDSRLRGNDGGGGNDGGYGDDGAGAGRDSRLRGNDEGGGNDGEIGKRVRGFTLLEVMIALLVIALGIGAVINTTSESGWKSSQLKEKTIANWIAQNQIAEYRARRIWDNKSNVSGDVEMANTDWTWRMKITKTDDPSLRRIDVEVYLDDAEVPTSSMTGFIANLK